jgi:hypothetical protein
LISQSHVWEPWSSLIVSYYIIQLLTTTFIWDHFGTHEKSYMRFETKTQESTDRSFVHKSSWKFFLSRYYNTICSCNSSCTWSWLNARSCCSNLVPKLLLLFPLSPQWTAMSGAECSWLKTFRGHLPNWLFTLRGSGRGWCQLEMLHTN